MWKHSSSSRQGRQGRTRPLPIGCRQVSDPLLLLPPRRPARRRRRQRWKEKAMRATSTTAASSSVTAATTMDRFLRCCRVRWARRNPLNSKAVVQEERHQRERMKDMKRATNLLQQPNNSQSLTRIIINIITHPASSALPRTSHRTRWRLRLQCRRLPPLPATGRRTTLRSSCWRCAR